MEEICGEVLIDLNQTWYTASPTFSRCISRTVFLLPPAILIFLSVIVSLFILCSRQSKKKPLSYVIISRVTLLVLVLGVHAAKVLLELNQDRSFISDYSYFSIVFVIILLNVVVEILHQLAGTHTSALQFFFWILQVICYIPTFKQNVDSFIGESEILIPFGFLMYIPLQLCSIV